jgi:spore maturation protein CgeB
MPAQDYFRLLNRSRIGLNALSNSDLVTTRHYEAMASESLVLCPRHSAYRGLFADTKNCVMFEPDLSDFDDRLFHYLNHETEREEIVERAYCHVHENHTWAVRVKKFTEVVGSYP